MNRSVTIFAVISFLFIHITNTDVPRDIYEKYNQSYNQWKNIKNLWNNSYQYTLGQSSWTGYRTSLTIFVVNGEVVGRQFTAYHRDQQREHWYEGKNELYSHGKKWGEVQPGTLDNIYSTCLQSLNVSTGSHHAGYDLVFEIDTTNHGLLKSCGNYPKGCQDDCFSGVSINNLKPYDQPQLSRNVVLTASSTNNPTTVGKAETTTNYGNPMIYSNFLLFLNIFIIKTIIYTFSY